ncbi:tetratricopeptide repeat protein 36 isoform X2 [Athene noctua]|uniref:tetratricopeptide repeat protein 36 isoform X2 n=1 Tax=Athene noctua TaxID=126797 RepID=UPI003EB86FCB
MSSLLLQRVALDFFLRVKKPIPAALEGGRAGAAPGQGAVSVRGRGTRVTLGTCGPSPWAGARGQRPAAEPRARAAIGRGRAAGAVDVDRPWGRGPEGTMATAGDRAVLQSIFSPSTPFGDIPGLDEEEEEEEEEEEDAQEDGDGFAPELLEQARDLELQGVSAAESGDVSAALERFGEAIRLLPQRASAYNNRAQALRLRGDLPGALRDLDASIRLSRGRGRAACQSFVQRGLIRRLQARDDEARQDFERAARLGSAFARQQLVLLNPYSALCNQMLCEMLGRLRNPGGAGSP